MIGEVSPTRTFGVWTCFQISVLQICFGPGVQGVGPAVNKL